MAELDGIKESFEYQQFIKEENINQRIKGEFLIPDTHPDVEEIISVFGRANITRKEKLAEKILIEGDIEYTVLYLAREDERLMLNSVSYNDKFSEYIEGLEPEHRISCEANSQIEHIEGKIINERKIAIEGHLNVRAECYKELQIDFLRDVKGISDIQLLRKPGIIDKLAAEKEIGFSGKGTIYISRDKPQVGKIIKSSVNIHKQEIKLSEDRVSVSCFCKAELLYRAADSRTVVAAEEDIFLNKEEELVGVNSSMVCLGDFSIVNYDLRVREDDLGEVRKIDLDIQGRTDLKVIEKYNVDLINDAYSPSVVVEAKQQDTSMGMIKDIGSAEAVVKENIQIPPAVVGPVNIITISGDAIITDKKIISGKAFIEGVLNAEVIYTAEEGEKEADKISSQETFNVTIDLPNSEDNINCIARCFIENIQGVIEGSTIGIRTIISVQAKSVANVVKRWMSSLELKEGEVQSKKASIIIYVVQPGDTVWSLAKKFAATMESVIRVNNLEQNQSLKEGTKLLIPGRAVI